MSIDATKVVVPEGAAAQAVARQQYLTGLQSANSLVRN